MSSVKKPVRLELNNSGSWKVIGRFEAADDEQSSLVLDAAEELIKTLHNSEDPKRCPTMRVSMDGGLGSVLLRWSLVDGWRDAETGRAA
jgi:small nuclear ribonucleoprotein (snRNP)-like protein